MPYYQVELDSSFHALANLTRRAVVQQLAGSRTSTVMKLHAGVDSAMALPSFLQHLRVLERAGLIATEKAGRTRTVRLRNEGLAMAEGWLSTQRGMWEQRLDQFESYLSRAADDVEGESGE